MARLVEYEAASTRQPGTEPAAAGGGRTLLLRHLKEGEQRAFGSLEQIECGARGVFLVVRNGDRVLRLSVPRMDAIEFISYRDDLTGEVGCGARKPPEPVYVTYRPVPEARGTAAAADGQAVAVEFVPKDYVPKTEKEP